MLDAGTVPTHYQGNCRNQQATVGTRWCRYAVSHCGQEVAGQISYTCKRSPLKRLVSLKGCYTRIGCEALGRFPIGLCERILVSGAWVSKTRSALQGRNFTLRSKLDILRIKAQNCGE